MNKSYLHDLITMNVTGLSKSQLFLKKDFSAEDKKKIEDKISRLDSGEPIEYIINSGEFYGLDFYVDNRVLVPRNDTEVMVEEVLKNIKRPSFLIDIGTGSGCIPISILKNTEKISNCFVVDISDKALEVAKINIKKHGLEEKIEVLKGDLLETINPSLLSSLPKDYALIITANLPYIKNGDFENMDEETIKFEPDLALYGGEKTGFELYEKLILQAIELSKLINISIDLFIEIGFDQKRLAERFLGKLNLKYQIFKDNGGIDRCVKINISNKKFLEKLEKVIK